MVWTLCHHPYYLCLLVFTCDLNAVTTVCSYVPQPILICDEIADLSYQPFVYKQELYTPVKCKILEAYSVANQYVIFGVA